MRRFLFVAIAAGTLAVLGIEFAFRSPPPRPAPASRSDAPLPDTALLDDAAAGRDEAVARLLDGGADVHAPDKRRERVGWTPLHSAAALGRLSTVELLLARGADRERKDASGRAPLHLAIYAKHRTVAERLTRGLAERDAFVAVALDPVEQVRTLLKGKRLANHTPVPWRRAA